MKVPFHVIFEDNHLLVINKPSGMATQGVTDGNSVYDHARRYIKEKFNKPGNVYLGIVSRLDTVTSGVLVLARTSKAASRLSQQIREGAIRKVYHALIEGTIRPDSGKLVDHMRKNDRAHRMVLCSSDHPDAKRAELLYRTLSTNDRNSLIEIELLTGRKHQIRVQFAARNHPLLGDSKYEATSRFAKGIALHAASVELTHPTQKTPMRFECEKPKSWLIEDRNML